jgi:acyl carrier protein
MESEGKYRYSKVLERHLSRTHPDEPIDGDRSFLYYGVDSATVILLLLDVEQEFSVTFPDDVLTAETFFSPKTLWDALQTCVLATGGPGGRA